MSQPLHLPPVDLQDIVGQEHVKRALEVSAAGAHPLLLRVGCLFSILEV